MKFGKTTWNTMFRTPQFYLRALSRKKHENSHQQTDRIGAYRLDQKVLEASRFTPYYHYQTTKF